MPKQASNLFWLLIGAALFLFLAAGWNYLDQMQGGFAFLMLFAAVFLMTRIGVRWAAKRTEHRTGDHA